MREETNGRYIKSDGYDEGKEIENGNRFLLANGYMGCRGTLDEYGKEMCPAFNMAGLYDGARGKWRETVNAPNPFYMKFFLDGTPLALPETPCASHRMELDMKRAALTRETVFDVSGVRITIRTERALLWDRYACAVSRTEISSDGDACVSVEWGIDSDVWDINGPHLKDFSFSLSGGVMFCDSETRETKTPLRVALAADGIEAESFDSGLCRGRFFLKAGKTKTVVRYASVRFGERREKAAGDMEDMRSRGYDAAVESHEKCWEERWARARVEICGNDELDAALRYSVYGLMSVSPRERGSIAARGLSGQTYKGAVFWDTEIFMLPFYLSTDPETARKLVKYRIDTLDGAERKAAEYGCGGAFYAWESQDGAEACTDFNVTDVFTHRKVRTYFRDRQIHISADVAYAFDAYTERTGDTSLLYSGGLKMLLECAWFYYTRARFNHVLARYELSDVMGPDEYHERVDNNAFTNYMVRHAVRLALKYYALAKKKNERYAAACADGIAPGLVGKLRDFCKKLYVPLPGPDGVIEQFDGYFKEEDVTVETVRSRLVDTREYWGGSGGVATSTRVIKQADVVALTVLLPDEFSADVVKANYEFYLPYTEHGSSLSWCMYALAACACGKPDEAADLFRKTAEIDLVGGGKQWAGEIYIGGTHPAACGGAYLVATRGFAGMREKKGGQVFSPSLPEEIDGVKFRLRDGDGLYECNVTKKEVTKKKT